MASSLEASLLAPLAAVCEASRLASLAIVCEAFPLALLAAVVAVGVVFFGEPVGVDFA